MATGVATGVVVQLLGRRVIVATHGAVVLIGGRRRLGQRTAPVDDCGEAEVRCRANAVVEGRDRTVPKAQNLNRSQHRVVSARQHVVAHIRKAAACSSIGV